MEELSLEELSLKEIRDFVKNNHLHHVHVIAEDDVYVIAEDHNEAIRMAKKYVKSYNLLEDASYDPEIVTHKSCIEDGWVYEKPVCKVGQVCNITCDEYLEMMIELERKNKIARDMDERQLKLNFV